MYPASVVASARSFPEALPATVSPSLPKRTRRGGLRKAQGSGYSDHELDIMLRVLPQIPRDWESENESWKQMTRRRTRLAEKLRETAEAVADDPDLKELSFDIRAKLRHSGHCAGWSAARVRYGDASPVAS